MAVQRFYLQSSGAPAVSPPFDAHWSDTASAVRLTANTVKQGTPITSRSVALPNNGNYLLYQFTTAPATAALTTSQCFFGAALRAAAVVTLLPVQSFGQSLVYKVTDITGTVVKFRIDNSISGAQGPPFASSLIYQSLPISAGFASKFSVAPILTNPFAMNYSDGFVLTNLLVGPPPNFLPNSLTITIGDRLVLEIGVFPIGASGQQVLVEAGDALSSDLDPSGKNIFAAGNGWVDLVDQSGPNGRGTFYPPTTGFFNQPA